MGELPHLKALVERYEGHPFAIIGVNTDKDPDDYRRQCEEQGVTWRSSFQGGTKGPLCKQWGVTAYPTLFLLDADGRIRFKGSRGEQLEADVAMLMAELGVEAPEEKVAGALSALGYMAELSGEEAAEAEATPAAILIPADRVAGAELTRELLALTEEYEAADKTWNEAWRALSGKERRDLKKLDPAKDFYARFEALAEAGSGGAKLWLVLNLDDATDLRSKELAAALDERYSELVEHFAGGSLAGGIADALIHKGRRVERSRRAWLLEELAGRSPDRGAGARALGKAIELLESRKASDEEQVHAKELNAFLLAEYLDTPEGVVVWGNSHAGAFEGVGKKIPDFPAVDTEGQAFRISDYEGQGVLLDFWGFW
jgi:peroxiredoxin